MIMLRRTAASDTKEVWQSCVKIEMNVNSCSNFVVMFTHDGVYTRNNNKKMTVTLYESRDMHF